MIKVRLARQGKGHNKFYRVVVINEKNKRNGKALEIVGQWQPSTKMLELNKKRIEAWVSKGAIISKAVQKLIQK